MENDKNSHSLSSQTASYTMNYEFEVTKTIADSFSATTTLPIDLYFNYRLPTTYSISIKDEANAVDITTGLAESYYLNTISPSSDINSFSLQLKCLPTFLGAPSSDVNLLKRQ